MALKKSELYSSLWKSCDELRGGMDASQYKDYVLVLLFVKYVSDKAAGNKDYLLNVPPGGGFKDMVAVKGDPEIGDKLNKIIAKLAKANGLEGVIDNPDADFNNPDKLGTGKEMVDRLSNLVGIFNTPELDFRGNRAEGDDLLGDAYEYLMRHFATESGKSKGQFYTPAEVSRVMAKVLGVAGVRSDTPTIYDPTCGSGSLLLKAHDEAKSATGRDFALFGQEMDNATAALAKMNMWLHDCGTAEIEKDNVLAAPHFRDEKNKDNLKTFDFVVANPPFSAKSWTNGVNVANDPYERFRFGVPPAKNGDMAFLLHILASLKSTGKAAVNLPHGVLFRGNAEAAIRREIVGRGYIKGVIGLPPNLFYGTGIPACIIVLDKEGAADRKAVFMIDASKGFVKDGNKNRLQAKDIHKIVDTFTRRVEIPRYSRAVPLTEIADKKNDYNLNIPRYIDSSEPEDLQDIDGHLRGGIPVRDIDALAKYWTVFPGVRDALIKKGDRTGYCMLAVAPAEIKAAIFGHAEFFKFNRSVNALFAEWTKENVGKLKGIAVGDRPKALIEMLSEHLLEVFRKVQLIDAYDVYVVDYKDLFKSLKGAVKDYTSGALDGYDKEDVAGLLEDRLEKARERLEETREAVKALCEPVEPPRDQAAYFRYFSSIEPGNAAQLKENEPKRLTLYKQVAALVRAYANIAGEMEAAGYTVADAAAVKDEVTHYECVRDEVKLHSGDAIDLKSYEPAMRHLIDTYIRAEGSEKVSEFDDLSLVQLLVERGADAVAALPPGIQKSETSVAETIENNVRKLIIDEHPINPKYYDRMSELLDALIEQRKQDAIAYREYLAQVVELTKQAKCPSGGASYPASLDTAGKRALFDNLENDEAKALAVDQAVREARQDDWRGNKFKAKKIWLAVKAVLGGDEGLTDRVLELVKNQHEY